ncbi:uroplakin-3b-like protein 1 [Tiliqua scincoides]|uniref:uroplakin-3b-like protein 1 n=1 Tax=Tiliqua scincoides TaxID=71010 RepID=UPI003462934F
MAALPLVVVAVVATVAINAVGAQGPPESYKPHLTTQNIEGRITGSTFVLDQPRCVFDDSVDTSEGIWLVVAKSDAVSNFKNPSSAEELPYQSFNNNSYYMTLDAGLWNYPCPAQSGELTLLRVGDEPDCVKEVSRPDCNGPLPGPGPYRVRFLAMDDKGVTAKTDWSDEITLIQAKDYNTIETAPKRRSAGMIAIATILSILFAILLAALIAALVYKYTDVCGNADIRTINEPATVTRYTTHHVYDQAPYKSFQEPAADLAQDKGGKCPGRWVRAPLGLCGNPH